MTKWNHKLDDILGIERQDITIDLRYYNEELDKHIGWNAGPTHPRYGVPQTDYQKMIVSKIHKGKIVSEETKEKMKKAWEKRKKTFVSPFANKEKMNAIKSSKEYRNKLSKANKGNKKCGRDMSGENNPMFGKKQSAEAKLKMSLAKKR